MRNKGLQLVGGLLLAALLSAPAWGTPDPPTTAYPGTLNYVDGQASIGSQALNSNSIGSVTLAAGQTITTEQGKAELLLTPGVFLRLGDASAVKMISPSLTDTEVAVQRGEATVEVTDIYKQNRLVVDEGNSRTELLKNGFYDFDADQGAVRVFSGEALLRDRDEQVKIKGGHQIILGADKLKAHGFDKTAYEGDLYRWSSLRSSYLAEANVDIAPLYWNTAWGWGPGWFGTGWYWDPWFNCYTFLPGDGFLYSPFGWGFYSPFYAYGAPWAFSGHYFHHFDPHAPASAPRYGHAFAGGGFHGGEVFHGGGFAGGGFHGGGGGGGFHDGGGGFGGHR